VRERVAVGRSVWVAVLNTVQIFDEDFLILLGGGGVC